jgi:hypothetical protein
MDDGRRQTPVLRPFKIAVLARSMNEGGERRAVQ